MTDTPTPPPANQTVQSSEGATVIIEQGPRWLVEFLYAPPPWVRPALTLLILVVVGLSVLAYHRHGIDQEVLEEASANVFVMMSCLGTTMLLVTHASLPYWGDVGLGSLGGFAFAYGAVLGIKRAADE